MNFPGPVAGENDRFLAHLGDEEISRILDLALVADIKPGARENPLLFFLVDVLVHENFAADFALVHVDKVAGGELGTFHKKARL